MSKGSYEKYLSPAMKEALATARRAAQSDSSILLQGESGSGKDHLARYIHYHSKLSKGPFFPINCAALPPELIESELFGYQVGAFTGARIPKKGLIEAASGGTLLLNEIGEIPFSLQAKLLTFLDTRKFIKVGGHRQVGADVRIIAATNRDLVRMVTEGSFRSDLFYRLNVISIVVPPLRDHKEDIPLLAKHLLVQMAGEMQREVVPLLEPATLERLVAYDWPGNVRELGYLLERCLVLSTDERHFNILIVEEIRERSNSSAQPTAPPVETGDAPIIEQLLQKVAGKRVRNPSANEKKRLYDECIVARHLKQVEIARKLGVSPSAVCKWLQSQGADDEVEVIR
jgi:transcriptional regulator with PAS, ATPase and Fis domain